MHWCRVHFWKIYFSVVTIHCAVCNRHHNVRNSHNKWLNVPNIVFTSKNCMSACLPVLGHIAGTRCNVLLPMFCGMSVCLSVCPFVCLPVGHNQSRCRLRYGLWRGGGPDPLVQFSGHLLAIVKYREYLACGRYSQPYLVDGSSDAAFNASSAATYYTLTKIINSCSFLLGLNNDLLISCAL